MAANETRCTGDQYSHGRYLVARIIKMIHELLEMGKGRR